MNRLQKELKEMRQHRGVSQNKLAEMLVDKGVLKSCTPAYISNLENKHFSNFDLFCKIAKVMGYDVHLSVYYS